MIVLVADKGVQGAVDSVVLARLDLDGNSGKAVVIVDQIVHFPLAAIVVIEQLVPVRDQLLGDNGFINGAQIDASFVIEDGADVIAIENSGQDACIIEVQLQKVFPEDSISGKTGLEIACTFNAIPALIRYSNSSA